MLKLSLRVLSVGLVLSLVAPAASAQRRIIGEEPPAAPEEKAEEKPDDKAPGKDGAASKKGDAKKDAAAEEKQKKAEAAREKAEAEAEEKRRAKEAAEEAAQKAADEAERKKRAAAEQKKRDAEEREKARLEANKAGRLKAAKKTRLLTRESGPVVVGLALEPGKVDADKLMELRLEVNERLEAEDPRYGRRKPLKNLQLTAVVEEPAKGKGPGKTYRYKVQPLKAPGSYGVHHTPRLEGEHTVRIEGVSKDGERDVSFSFPVHVGAWPPPDFDEEEAKNAKETAGRASGSRRILGSN